MEEHRPKRLSHQVGDGIHLKRHSYCIEQAYVGWIKRTTYFHGVRNPREIGNAEIEAFMAAQNLHRS